MCRAVHAPLFDDVATGRSEEGMRKRAGIYPRGGSIPFVTQMYDPFRGAGDPSGFGLPDENAHAPDEHIARGKLFGGIKAVAQFDDGLLAVANSKAYNPSCSRGFFIRPLPV